VFCFEVNFPFLLEREIFVYILMGKIWPLPNANPGGEVKDVETDRSKYEKPGAGCFPFFRV